MEKEIKKMFKEIDEPQFAELESIYDLTKDDIRYLKTKDKFRLFEMCNWKTHPTRRLLMSVVNDWCEHHKCYTLHY